MITISAQETDYPEASRGFSQSSKANAAIGQISPQCVGKKNQLYATECFIALMICSTCFGHFYAHHQELETTSNQALHTIGGNNTHSLELLMMGIEVPEIHVY